MNLLASVYNQYRKFRYVNSFIRATKDPMGAQEKLLLKIINKNKNTVFGKERNFSSIKTVEDYRKNVPVMDYEEFRPYIERIKNGEQNVLTRDEVVFFSTTSGTTSEPKFCPETKRQIYLYTRNLQIFLYFAYKDHNEMFDSSILSVVSKAARNHTKSNIPIGAISGLVYNSEPPYVKKYYSVPEEVFDIEDYEAKYYCVMRFALENEINFILTPNPSTILLLCHMAIKNKEWIIEDIKEGTIHEKFAIEGNIRKSLLQKLRKNPLRASFLKSLDNEGKFMPKHYWPGLKFIACWKEGTLGHYIKQLQRYFENTAIRDLGLIASEAYCSIPISDNANAGILTIDTNFYEFLDTETQELHRAETLSLNREYSLIITNCAGFYRYNLNDIVRVVDFHNKTPIIKFIHRANNTTSITGEKLTEWQAVTAVNKSSEKYEIPVHHFTFYANMSKKGNYDLYLELYGPADKKKLRLFLKEVDVQLMELNMEYKDKRKSGRLGDPVLKILEEKSYHAMHKKRSILYGQDSQIKLPVLTDDKGFKSGIRVIEEVKV